MSPWEAAVDMLARLIVVAVALWWLRQLRRARRELRQARADLAHLREELAQRTGAPS